MPHSVLPSPDSFDLKSLLGTNRIMSSLLSLTSAENRSNLQLMASSYISPSQRLTNLAKEQISHYPTQMMLPVQSKLYFASSENTHALPLTLYSHVSWALSISVGSLKTSNLPFSKLEFLISVNTQVIPFVAEQQIQQYQRNSH